MSGSPAKFLNTTGRGTLGIGVCDRCKTKRSLEDLVSDQNIPGLKVCRDDSEGCRDVYDPYRLPARQTDKMTLPFYRPDEPIEAPPGGFPKPNPRHDGDYVVQPLDPFRDG